MEIDCLSDISILTNSIYIRHVRVHNPTFYNCFGSYIPLAYKYSELLAFLMMANPEKRFRRMQFIMCCKYSRIGRKIVLEKSYSIAIDDVEL